MTTSIDFAAIGNKHKFYEAAGEKNPQLLPGLPIMARMDGRAFHTLTKNLKRPYDTGFMQAMIATMKHLVKEFNADVGYCQSDEISLLWKNETVDPATIMFGGRRLKWVGLLAATTAVVFDRSMTGLSASQVPVFDARVWQYPTLDLAVECLLWREMDATKNAVSMAASAVFSEKVLNGKTVNERKQLLYERGIVFGDYPTSFKRGTYAAKRQVLTYIPDEEWECIPGIHRPDSRFVPRSRVVELQLNPLITYADRTKAIFEADYEK